MANFEALRRNISLRANLILLKSVGPLDLRFVLIDILLCTKVKITHIIYYILVFDVKYLIEYENSEDSLNS